MVDALGVVQMILSLVGAIKGAVDKAKENKEDCQAIATRVESLGADLSSLDNNTAATKVTPALDDLHLALLKALQVIMDCENKSTVSRYANAENLSKVLRGANKNISAQMKRVTFVASLHSNIVLNTTQQEETASISWSKKFDLPELKYATDDFSEENVIGKSASCRVYRGKFRDGTKVAVRSYSEEQQCENEAYFAANLVHKNVVKLLGYCFTRERCCLVYEYMDNKSLAVYINGDRENWKNWKLSWERCLKIIKGIAQGVLYLHDFCDLSVIHLNLKPSKILLDNGFNPKISGFGISEMLPGSGVVRNFGLKGTHGFQAPEYVGVHGEISFKTDVYSYGILLLKFITGMNCGQDDYDFRKIDQWDLIIDYERFYTNRGELPIEEINRCIHIALLCCEEDPALRPTMARVCTMLSSKEVKLDDTQNPVHTGPRY